MWTVLSDARLKDTLGDFKLGIEEVCALRPRIFSYNGQWRLGHPHVHVLLSSHLQLLVVVCARETGKRLAQVTPRLRWRRPPRNRSLTGLILSVRFVLCGPFCV